MKTLILNGILVNEGQTQQADLLIVNGRIHKIGKDLQSSEADKVIDAAGKYVLPGMIDDQVHFREPGLTHKGGLQTESRAAVAGVDAQARELRTRAHAPRLSRPVRGQRGCAASATSWRCSARGKISPLARETPSVRTWRCCPAAIPLLPPPRRTLRCLLECCWPERGR